MGEYGKMESLRKQDILVYGAGDFFNRNKEIIREQYHIKAIIDKNKQGFLEEWKLIKIDECTDIAYEKVIIMVENIRECFLIVKDLLNVGVESEKIVVGGGLYGAYADKYDEIKVLPDGKMRVSRNGIKVAVRSIDEFNNVYATLVGGWYRYKLNNSKKDIVIDVGMNIGDTTLYFLANNKVEKVYAFEPFQKTFLDAKENLSEYINDSGRVEIFQYGLSDVTEERTIFFNEDMSCGMSTKSAEEMDGYDVYGFYYNNGLAEREKEESEKILVKNAADVLAPIIEKHKRNNNIVLKMNCEGEEYGIIEILNKEGVLSQIDFIILEWHYQGNERIIDELSKAGFSYYCAEEKKNMGQMCAWRCGV